MTNYGEGTTSDHQFGFRPDHATIDQLHQLAIKIRQVLGDRLYSAVIFLDIIQAFEQATGLNNIQAKTSTTAAVFSHSSIIIYKSSLSC